MDDEEVNRVVLKCIFEKEYNIVKSFIPEIVIRRVNNVMDSNRKLGAYLEKAGMKAAVE